MRFMAFIQARCGSSRLPEKVLLNLAGKPVLQRVVERVKKSRLLDDVMVVTSVEKNNLPLIHLCAEIDTRVFVGSEEDVLDRYYQAARFFKPEYVVRITADCPMFDWRYLDMAIEELKPDSDDLRDVGETFPDGLDLEILRFSTLKEIWEKAQLKSEREHVTLYLRNHADEYKIQDFRCPILNAGSYRWTLDEENDYRFISQVYDHFIGMGKEDFITEDVISLLHENPTLLEINSGINRNEGLKKSLENDMVISNEIFS